jgi:hypothetical protein
MKKIIFCFLTALGISGVIANQSDVLTMLREGRPLVCEPEEAFFCGNMHVSCAGKTNLATFPFHLQVADEKATFVALSDHEVYTALFLTSRVEWGSDAPYLVISPTTAKGYIKIFPNGRYVFRFYPSKESDGVMSLGLCR